MASQPVRQSDFSGGEIAPQSYGKTDARAYQFGLRTALNFIPTLEGPILNRSGSRFKVEAKDSSYAPRILSFEFAEGQNFLLEVGNLYIRFYLAGVLMQEVVSPWRIADVDRLTWTQDGDVLTFLCVNGATEYPVYEVSRIANNNWTVTQVVYSPQACWGGRPRFANREAEAVGSYPCIGAALSADEWDQFTLYWTGDVVIRRIVAGNIFEHTKVYMLQSLADGNLNHSPDASPTWWVNLTWDSTFTYRRGDYVFAQTTVAGDGTMFISLADQNKGHDPNGDATQTWWAVAGDSARTPQKRQYVVTQLWRDSAGRVAETSASNPTSLYRIVLGSDRPGVLSWYSDIGTGPADGWTRLEDRVYGGKNGIFGYIGSLPAVAGQTDHSATQGGTPQQVSFVLDGTEPNFGVQPPRGDDPWKLPDGTHSYPRAGTYHEQRLVAGGTRKKPQSFRGSAEGFPKIFDINTPAQDSDTYDLKPASERLEDIRSMLSLRHLLLFTGGGVWNCYGAAGPMTAKGTIIRRAKGQGAKYLRPLAVDLSALYVTSRGNVRDLVFDLRADTYGGRDVSAIARHLIDRRTIVDWAYAEAPFSVVWAVRDDGTLLSMTYAVGAVEAWARHTTAGVYERVAVVPEDDPYTGVLEDAVYVVVKRIINGATKRYIERFSSRLLPQQSATADDGTVTYTTDMRFANFLDSSSEYDGRNTAVLGVQLDGASHNAGDQCDLHASSAAFIAGNVGDSIILEPDGDAVELKIVAYVSNVEVTVELQSDFTAAQISKWVDNNTTAWGLAKKTITGLDHLEGQTVNALLDGAVAGPFVVQGGSITLGDAACVVQVGIPYNSDLELLDYSGSGVRTNQKTVRRVYFEVFETRGLYAGESFEMMETHPNARLYESSLKKISDGAGPPKLFTGTANVDIDSTWNLAGRACLRQSDPLPATVVSATRELVVAGR